jgi:16S rRNA (guanine(966)-N(2))-methyltransferase RsmD
MFAMLEAAGAAFSNVLDLYSGTGALGIEALSRGDGRCDFVEADTKTAAVIRENLVRTALIDRARVYPLQVSKALNRLTGPYTLVVADPPYEYDRAQSELANVIERGLLAEDGVLIVEHSKRHEWPETLGGLTRVDTRRYGDTRVSMYTTAK